MLGKTWESVLGCRKSKGRDGGGWGSVEDRCGKVCGGGKGRCGERCGEVLGEVLECGRGRGDVGVWESVLGCGGGVGKCVMMWGGVEVLREVEEGVLRWGGGKGRWGESVGNVEKCWGRCGKGRSGERCAGCVEVLGKVWESVLE